MTMFTLMDTSFLWIFLYVGLIFVVNECHSQTAHKLNDCPSGFVFLPIANGCYKVVLDPLNWEKAQANCQNTSGATLAVISDEYIDYDVVNYIRTFTSQQTKLCGRAFFNGAQRTVTGDCTNFFVWKSSSNAMIPMRYSRWDTNQPDCYSDNQNKNESCASYWSDKDNSFNDYHCDWKSCSICQWVPDCPSGFVFLPIANGCYKAVLEPLKWEEARSSCQSTPGATLAVISDRYIDFDVVNYLNTLTSKDTINCEDLFSTISFYIGAQRTVLGNCSTSFVWTPSTNVQIPMKYSRWAANQPDCYSHDKHKNESCASYQILKKNTAFNDRPCDMPHCSICQWVVSGQISKSGDVMVVHQSTQAVGSYISTACLSVALIALFSVFVYVLCKKARNKNAVSPTSMPNIKTPQYVALAPRNETTSSMYEELPVRYENCDSLQL